MHLFSRPALDPEHVAILVRALTALDVPAWEARCTADPHLVPPPDVKALADLALDYRTGATGQGDPRRLPDRHLETCLRVIARSDPSWIRPLLEQQGYTFGPGLTVQRRWIWAACADDPTARLVGRTRFYEMLYALPGLGRFRRPDGWYLSGIGAA